jgi:hypothetical protein
MSLENLLKTKQLQPHNPTREAAQRLLQAAARNIADAQVKGASINPDCPLECACM